MIPATGLPQIVDTHVHLDEPAFDLDRDTVLDEARSLGVRRFINIAYKPERWESSRAIQLVNKDVAVAIGLHPAESATLDPETERSLVRAIEECQPVAIGETGFDFARTGPTFLEQARAFRTQIEISSSRSLPIIIHQRNASDALMKDLDEWPDVADIVLHSFDGTALLTGWAVERGCYIGIGGLATRPGSVALRNLLRSIPVDRLLLETDAPYLSPPQCHRRNTPANLPQISQLLAPIWGMTAADLRRVTTENANSLFKLGLAAELEIRA